ncbi:MAG: ATP-binding protein, partial [bacterium]
CLGIVATVAMFLDVVVGVQVVLPIFITWAATMIVITVVMLSWSKQARTINEFYADIERKYQSIFEFSPEAILLLDTTGMILASNERLHEWLDVKTKDIVGKNIVTLPFLTEESKANIMKNFAERLLNKETPSYQVEFFNNKGAKMFGQVVAATVRDKNGEIIRNLTMISDVTERVKLEHLKEDLTHMIAHDLKNPLIALSGLAELFLSDHSANLDDRQKELLNSILSSAKKTTNFAMDLLQINNIEDNNLQLTRRRIKGIELLTHLNWLKPNAEQREITLELKSAEAIEMEIDINIISRVLENLVLNALKHTPAKGKVQVNISSAKQQVLFEVIDSGEGIPAEYLDKLFNKYFRVEAQKQTSKYDTGLGLTFCKMAVEAHGGKIEVESKLGKGARFFFQLPQNFSSIGQAL